jgi:hypothetical protein
MKRTTPMFKTIAIATAITVSLSAYAAHSWAFGPRPTAEAFSVTSGQCKLVAEIADSAGGFVVASGHPQFVGGLQLGNRTSIPLA